MDEDDRVHTGRATVDYDAAVTEALAVGWVDSSGQRLAEGRLGPAGQAAIDAATVNGTWTLLDDVEDPHRRDRREGESRQAGPPVTSAGR